MLKIEGNVEIITIGDEKPIKEYLTEEEIKKAMTDKSIFQITLEEKDKEIERLNNIIDELKDDSRILKEFSAWVVNRHEPDLFHKMEIVNRLSKLKELKGGKEYV